MTRGERCNVHRHQAEVVILGQPRAAGPTPAGREASELKVALPHWQDELIDVGPKVGVRDHYAFGITSRARCELEEGQVGWRRLVERGCGRQRGAVAALGQTLDVAPLEILWPAVEQALGSLESHHHRVAQAECRAARLGNERHLVDGLLHLGRISRVDGNRDHARAQARPEHDKELWPRRKAEQHPLAARAAPRAKQQLRQHACTPPERAKREHLGLGAPVVEPGEAFFLLLPRHHALYLGEEARCVAKRPPPAGPSRCHDLPQGGMGMRVGAKVRVLVRAHVRACVCEGWVLSGRAMLPAPMRSGGSRSS
eukprot:scaffold56724_cov67-Phaeocystis_antarctica.AAC.6